MANLRNGFDLNTVDEDELEKSKQMLIDQKPLLRGYSTDDIQNMINGNAWIHHGWNGDVVNIRNQVDEPRGLPVREGQGGHPGRHRHDRDPGEREHPGTALLFIDFMLDPENAAQNVAYFGYPMPSTGAEDAFAKIAKDDPAINDHRRGPRERRAVRAPDRRGQGPLGPDLDRGQGCVSEQRFATTLLLPGGLWLLLLFAVPLGLVLAALARVDRRPRQHDLRLAPRELQARLRPALPPGAAALGRLRARDRRRSAC